MKQLGTRAANVARGDEAAEEALARRQIETAKQIVAALGSMKGAAMKIGQVMSFLDVGLVPAEYREEFQHELAKLRDAAPTVSFKQMRHVIEDELEGRIHYPFVIFAETSYEPQKRITVNGREVSVVLHKAEDNPVYQDLVKFLKTFEP